MRAYKDLSGSVFGRLTVIRRNDQVLSSGRKVLAWDCKCECGSETRVITGSLTGGKTKSCGCYGVEKSKERTAGSNHPMFKHGLHKVPGYDCWGGARRRALGMRPRDAHNYSERGITMCQRWLDSFENFLSDMGPCPPGLTLDRIDNDGDYEPGNCRWATRSQQAKNRRGSVIIEIDGVARNRSEWSEISGIGDTTIRFRLKLGWTPRDAVFKPVQGTKSS